MARTSLAMALLIVAVATGICRSSAQTRAPVTYTVGDVNGWNVLGDDAYDRWAEGKTFYVGDVLVFNFINGTHDVAEVTEAAYDSCNGTSPISRQTTSPVRITLTTPGDHYYICTFSGHCAGGQKLDIDVLPSSTPAPAPAVPTTPTPTSAPAPTTAAPAPARTPVTYTVGDVNGWNVLGDDAYDRWTEGKTFYVGDVLVFNFINGTHDVAEVTEAAYDSCNGTSPISRQTTSPVRITLTTPGDHYYICTFSGHCAGGQKLDIDVLPSTTPAPAVPTTPTPASAPSPTTNAPAPVPARATPAPAPTPARTPVTYTVGDANGWNVLGDDAYDRWEEGKTFYVGDVLVFNFINGTHDVAEVTEAAYDSCTGSSPISRQTLSPVRITLTTPGDHYYICTFSGHCAGGQKLDIDVLASPTGTTPTTPSPPTTTTPTTPSPTGSTTSPPPPGSSAASIGITALASTVLSAVVALFMF